MTWEIKKFLGFLFYIYILWIMCRASSLCNYPYLNRRFNIVIRSKWLARILIGHSYIEETKNLMGIHGIIHYITWIPSAIYLWVRDGAFLFFFNVDEIIISPWLEILFWSELLLLEIDFWIGYYLAWRKKQPKRKCPAITHIVWKEDLSNEVRDQAEKIFMDADKIFWDFESQKLYYKRGDDLLTLSASGEFISLTAEGDSAFVRMLMRTTTCTFSAERKEKD